MEFQAALKLNPPREKRELSTSISKLTTKLQMPKDHAEAEIKPYSKNGGFLRDVKFGQQRIPHDKE